MNRSSHTDAAPRFDFDGEYGRMYDDLVRRVIPGYEDAFVAILSLLEELLPQQASLLVVGAGTGMEISSFAPKHQNWFFTAVDPIPEMVRATMTVAEALGVASRVTPFTGTVDLLPETPHFDGATVINVLHFLPDDGSKAGLLRSVASRLRPGSPLILFDLHGEPGSADYTRMRAVWRRFQSHRGLDEPAVADFNARLDSGMHFVGSGRMRTIWEGAGLVWEVMFWKTLLYGGWLLRTGSQDGTQPRT
jgi:tRNA (cmo5U34)-methyltransferase